MHTKMVYQAAKGLARIGCVVLRFNFRGVGRSAGAFDEGRGEQDDVRAAIGYMREHFPGLEVWAAGASFGAMSRDGRALDERVTALIGIAPPSTATTSRWSRPRGSPSSSCTARRATS